MKDLRMGCDPGVDLYTAVVDIIEGRLIKKQFFGLFHGSYVVFGKEKPRAYNTEYLFVL